MPYYEWQWLVDDLQEHLEEQQKANKDATVSNNINKDAKRMQTDMLRQQQNMMNQQFKRFDIPMPKGAFDF